MFFNSCDFNITISSALSLKWDSSNGKSSYRPYHALSMRITGDATMSSNDGDVELTSGDIVFVPAGKMYRIKAGHEKLIVIHFTSDVPPCDKIQKFTPKLPSYYESRMRELYAVWNKRAHGYKLECHAIFYKILSAMEREAADVRKVPCDMIIEAEEYIREHFCDRELNINDLSKKCGMSDTYFRRLFIERYGMTPLKYINKLKLGYAMELLESRYYTVGEVADMCGFNNINYFSTFIKKELGISPKNI